MSAEVGALPATGAPLGPDGGVRRLAQYGESTVPESGERVTIGEHHAIWLVTHGWFDLFAADLDQRSPLQHLGRLEPGTILAGTDPGRGHQLVVRPGDRGVLSVIPMAELARAQHEAWRHERGTQQCSEIEATLAAGIDRGLAVLLDAIRDGDPPTDVGRLPAAGMVEMSPGEHAGPCDGTSWARVHRGRVAVAAAGEARECEAGEFVVLSDGDSLTSMAATSLSTCTTVELLLSGRLWDHLMAQQAALMSAVNRVVQHRTRIADEQLDAGRKASTDAMADAERTLRVAAQPHRHDSAALPADGPLVAACRIVARAGGITMLDSVADDAADHMEPVDQIAARSGFRTRPVRLGQSWWREGVGPLLGFHGPDRRPVALLWRRSRYHMADPETGQSTRLTSELAIGVSNQALMFYTPLPPGPVTGKQLLRLGLRGTGADWARLAIGGLVASVLAISVPVITGKVLGEYVPAGEHRLVVLACLAVLVASVVSAAFTVLSGVSTLRLQGRADATLQSAVWDRLLRLPTSFFARYSAGELANRALAINAIRQVVSGIAVVTINAGLMGLVNFGILVWYNAQLAILAAALLVAHSAVFIPVSLRQVHWQRQLIDIKYILANYVYQTLRSMPKIRVATAENFAYARWADDFAKSRELSRRVRRAQNNIAVFNAAYIPFSTLLLFALVAGPARGTLSVAGFITFITAFGATLAAAAQLTGALTSAAAAVPIYAKLKPLLEEEPETTPHSTLPGRLSGEIDVANVCFRYTPDGPLILDDVSLHIRPGEFVAIAGPTGSGKSTLLRLLLGFEQPSTGIIRFDKHDLADLDVAAVRRQFGVVIQGADLFPGTILSNIRGAGNYSMDETWEAARLAGIDEDIRNMPMGMHTVISDNASGLSGGQQQRLTIAQALIRRPSVLFFDEATSALDNETQNVVTRSTQELNATRIVIAHRLSTIMNADRVIVLSQGTIVQSGTPAELLADQDGIFYDLARRQVT